MTRLAFAEATGVIAVRNCVTAVAAIVLMVYANPSTAFAVETPVWRLSSSARPTHLASEAGAFAGRTEVEEVKVSGTEGDFYFAESFGELFFNHHLAERTLPFDASGAEVQRVLEEMYGTGNIRVEAVKPSKTEEEEATHSWLVTFTGQLTNEHVTVHPGPRSWELSELPCGFVEELGGGSCMGEPSKIFKSLAGGTKEPEVIEKTAAEIPERQIVLTAANLGDASTNGAVTISDKLPRGVEVAGVEALAGDSQVEGLGAVNCSGVTVSCKFEGSLPPFDRIEMRIGVRVTTPDAPAVMNEATVSGGGLPSVSVQKQIDLSTAPTPFGVEEYHLALEEEEGRTDTQAGSHPFQFTTTVAINQNAAAQPAEALPKDLKINLPPGLVGDPVAFPRCTLHQFLERSKTGVGDECQANTAVGVAMVTYHTRIGRDIESATVPVFNIEPSVGEPARFGFFLPLTPVFIDPTVRSGEDYGLTANVNNVSQTAGFLRSEVTLWGVPGDPRHDNMRGWGCIRDEHEKALEPVFCNKAREAVSPPALMIAPTACSEPLRTSIELDSWTSPGKMLGPVSPTQPMGQLDGCDALPFDPHISVTPDGTSAATPTGMRVDEHIPQETLLLPKGHAESAIKGLTVTLPEGVTLNPSAAEGLQSCSLEEMGLTNGVAPSCPASAKIGTVSIRSPLLPASDHFEGSAYLATQNQNPFGSLSAVYLFAEDPTAGVRVKAAGEVSENPVTGQLTAHFEEDPVFRAKSEAFRFLPQLPAEDIEVHFFGGEHAPLATPHHCGDFMATATFTPWSGDQPTTVSSGPFAITSGPHSTPCESLLQFNPKLTAGSTNIQAGAFTPFTSTISHEDGQEDLQRVALHLPPGLSGLLAGVRLCGEQEANDGTCGPESLLGETTVSVGLGSNPFTVSGGRVYITGPYHGAPFGLSIVQPAKAGPFDLEHDLASQSNHPGCDCLVVRAKVEVDRHTAQLTVATDSVAEHGTHPIPRILDGVPLLIKHINVTVNRPRFMFNPTDCNGLSIGATLESANAAAASASVPFQVTNCAALSFHPTFKVSTNGHTSRTKGASLNVKLSYPKAPFGSQANIAKVKVALPRQLPSRLSTLQRACPAATFDANPAECPPASIVGHARVLTPLVPVPLTGPAYFVSHGGEAFPDLTIMLQGYGVTVEIVGSTSIKRGITTSTFNTVPDVPFSLFELNLPQGPYSALAAIGNVCKQHLRMPARLTAQNGLEITQRPTIAPTRCSPHKRRGRKRKGH